MIIDLIALSSIERNRQQLSLMKQRSFLGTISSSTIDASMVSSAGCIGGYSSIHNSSNLSIASTNSRTNIRSETNKENTILSRDSSRSVHTRPSSSSVGNRMNVGASSYHPVKLIGDSLINTINLLKNTEDLIVESTSSTTMITSSGKDIVHSASIMRSSKDDSSGGGSNSSGSSRIVRDDSDSNGRRVCRPMEMILSGNIPRTYDNNYNSNNNNKNKSIASTSSSSSSAAAAVAKDRVINNEIEQLLNKKSSHAEEANNEWFDGYSKRLTQLSKREYAQTKAAQIQSIEIQAFCCTNSECNLSKQERLVEQFPTYCHSKGHHIERSIAIKRFFECKQCNKRECTLNKKKDVHTKVILPPEIRCIVCGAYRWTVCGQKGSGPLDVSMKEADNNSTGGPKMMDPTIRGGQLFLSATDWTKKRDSVSMAERVSRLL